MPPFITMSHGSEGLAYGLSSVSRWSSSPTAADPNRKARPEQDFLEDQSFFFFFFRPRPYISTMTRSSAFVVRAEYGNMWMSFLGASRVTSTECGLQYLRMPCGPCRTPMPDSFQPPNGSSFAA